VTRVVIGAPVYSGGQYAGPALESLLAQSYRDFRLVVCDDQSRDGTWDVVERLAATDARIHAERNSTRLGMVGNWRRSFEVARETCPEMEYFAWVSDHDFWKPEWLETLVGALDRDPQAVLAYPRATGVRNGDEVVHTPRDFDTSALVKRRPRMRATWHHMQAGYMVYGLYRADALERSGVYRYVRDPDRLLLFELSAHGTFLQLPETLFLRRRTQAKPSPKRQMAGFFPGRRRPLYTRLPWPLVHSGSVMWSLGVKGNGKPQVGRLRGIGIGLWCLTLAVGLESRRQIRLAQRSSHTPIRTAANAAAKVITVKPLPPASTLLPGAPRGPGARPTAKGPPKRPKAQRDPKPGKPQKPPKRPAA